MKPLNIYQRNTAYSMPYDYEAHTMTSQEYRDEVNINTIVKRYTLKTFEEKWSQESYEKFIDTTILPQDFASAQQVMLDAQNMFDDLPSTVRARFNHNPAQLYKHLHDEKALKELGGDPSHLLTYLCDPDGYKAAKKAYLDRQEAEKTVEEEANKA
jgi:hypothetical protein